MDQKGGQRKFLISLILNCLFLNNILQNLLDETEIVGYQVEKRTKAQIYIPRHMQKIELPLAPLLVHLLQFLHIWNKNYFRSIIRYELLIRFYLTTYFKHYKVQCFEYIWYHFILHLGVEEYKKNLVKSFSLMCFSQV